MAHFAISYDLVKSRNYKRIIDEIERLGGCRIVESVYFITLPWTTAQVRDHFSRFIDDDDLMVVIPIGGRPFYSRAYTLGTNWIKKHFP